MTDDEILDGFAEARVFTEFCMTRLERRLSALDHRIMIKIGEIEKSFDCPERRLTAVEKEPLMYWRYPQGAVFREDQ